MSWASFTSSRKKELGGRIGSKINDLVCCSRLWSIIERDQRLVVLSRDETYCSSKWFLEGIKGEAGNKIGS